MSDESSVRYDVLTWDAVAESYTEQDGMVEPCLGVTLSGLRRALRELRSDFAYCCRRIRLADGSYSSDAAVLVERVDGSFPTCGLCRQDVGATLVDGVLYCDDCLSPEEVSF